MHSKEKSFTVTIGIFMKSGHSSRVWFSKWQTRHGRGVTGSIGGVRSDVSSLCFPLSNILTRSTGDGEADRCYTVCIIKSLAVHTRV